MNEFSQMIELVKQELLRSDAQMEVLGAYPQQLRARPQRQKLAVVAIQKVLMQPLGMQSFYGEEDQPLGRQAQVWMKISFCCPSGEECWQLWEGCAQRLLFSDKLGAEQIECGEAVWQKDWGGVVLPVKLCCKFLISGSTGKRPSRCRSRCAWSEKGCRNEQELSSGGVLGVRRHQPQEGDAGPVCFLLWSSQGSRREKPACGRRGAAEKFGAAG